ncbi:glucokinase [Methylotenera sp.]|uniref:glucokinase n=1 Tax=Methylotenera sp. TaxID=2051956 RepID=UPI00273684CC|nr:glucokinase [Methylotenera sp.]MDP3004636.1 glucokinase [Methylotenera sp.]
MKILAGDIGGTKTELAIFDAEQLATSSSVTPLFGMHFLNREQDDFISMLRNFMAQANIPVQAACLAVAGAVRDGRSRMPNLDWVLDEREIRIALGVEQVTLINDLAANAHGMLTLPPEQLMVINPGVTDARGNLALIAAGTGLGEAVLFRDGQGAYQVSASEGGHADYAPNNENEMELLRYLWSRFGHVSWERVVSGSGIVNIYDFLSHTGQYSEPAYVTSHILEATDRAAAITQAAQKGESHRCIEALDVFLHNYGAAAGNLALKSLATGGLFIGGGIAPKLAQHINKGGFMRAFNYKGRFSELMARVPVKLILEPKTALMGAAVYATKTTSH